MMPTSPATRSIARDMTFQSAVLYATLVVGALDASDGMVFFGLQGQSPIHVLQYIASSVLGLRSFSDGFGSACLGLVLHFAVSAIVAVVYIAASGRIACLRRQWIPCGVVYGAAVWLFMNLVFLPHTAAAQEAIPTSAWFNGIIGHALFVGLPCAFFARRVPSVQRAGTEAAAQGAL